MTTKFVYNGHTYLLSTAGTWASAQAEAKSLGGNLVTINDKAENDWLISTFGKSGHLWIGYTDQETEGTFKWITGENSTYTNWSKGEPNGDSKGNDDYVVTNWINSGYWNDCPTDFTKVAGIIEITPVTFLPQRTFKPGNYPLSIINTDLNNDGILDLAASNVGGGVSVLLGLGDGNFNKSVTYTVGKNPRNIAFADFNKDGKIDLINTNGDDSNVSLLLGNGDGTFKNQSNFLVGKSPGSVTTADFNNDGNLDAVTLNSGNTNNISLLLGDGKGSFLSQKNISVGTNTTLPSSNIISGDINKDGNTDLVVATGNNISVLLGNGKGGFDTPVISQVGTTASTTNIVTADFDNDGFADLATSNNNSITVLYGKGNGSFSLSTLFDASYATVNTGDFNNDGNLDLVTTHLGTKSSSVYLGDGKGKFGAATSLNVGEQPESSTLGDFNNDGKIDIAITNWATSDISVLVNSTVMPAYTVTKSDGSLVAWGERFLGNSITNKIPDVKKTYSNSANTAFAMLKNDGSVITTGSKKGDIEQTGNQMDIAIKGNGFLQVKMPDGTFGYTRDGQLKLDINGQIVTASDLPLMPIMTIPQDALSIAIATDGTVSILQPNNPKPSNIGQIQLAVFSDNTKLEKITGYDMEIYKSTQSSGAPLISTPGLKNTGSIIQSGLEVPNVGGDSSDVKMQINGDIDVKDIFANQYAFAALRTDGSVISWGENWNGGDSSLVKSQLDGTIDVTKIYSNDSSFAAIRVDGSVVTWGAASDGGDSSKVKSQIDGKNDVVKIYSTTSIYPDSYNWGNADFVALRADGSVVTWGTINTWMQLNLAINGTGFFQVTMPDGSLSYTRDGQFRLDSDGQIVTDSGLPISPSITIPKDALSIMIGPDGTVSVYQPNNPIQANVGQIQLATFKNPDALKSAGQNLYKQSTTSGTPDIVTPGDKGGGSIIQSELDAFDCYNSILSTELNGNNDIKEIYSTTSAHAALRVDGSVITWGDKFRGGDSSVVSQKIDGKIDVVNIIPNNWAFAALRSDGSVVTWGHGLQYSGIQGNVVQTGNQLDIAINGRGLLQVEMPDGTKAYTRDGHLKIDQTGQLVTENNLLILPSMTIPQDALSITIGTDGTVSILQPNNPQPVNVGQIQTANFINLAGLVSIGENLYRETNASGPPVIGTPGQQEFGAIVQNCLESNINSGGDSSWVSKQLSGDIDVKKIYPNEDLGFVALRVDNSLVMWGAEHLELDNISKIYSNSSGAFAALSDDGKVVTWGSYYNGGNSSLVTKELNGDIPVVDIQASDFAFAALRSDGSVITWGNASNGGDSTTVANAINSGVVSFEKENHLPTGKIEISGTVKEKEILVATNSLDDLDGLGDFHYQWLADGKEILNANSSSYRLSTSDIGKKISVSIDYIDGEGNNEIKVSAETGVVISAFSLKPSTGNDQVIGTSKNEKIDTLSGDDSIDGLAGNDTLIGGTGNDTLIGGLGKDNLTGGLGADVFKYNSTVESGITTSTQDTITDFKHTDNDKIDLSLIDANTTLTGIQKFNFINNSAFSKTNAAGQLRFDSTSHVLYGSTNSDNKAEFSIFLSGLKTLVVDDLLL